MTKSSVIPNKTTTSLSINRDFLAQAKARGINISLVLDSALEKELNVHSHTAYMHALENQIRTFKAYINKNDMQTHFENWKWSNDGIKEVGNDVLEKKQSTLGENLELVKDS